MKTSSRTRHDSRPRTCRKSAGRAPVCEMLEDRTLFSAVPVLMESFEAFPAGWVVGNDGGTLAAKWGDNTAKSTHGARSAFCADNGSDTRATYDNDLHTFLDRRGLSLAGATKATLGFNYWINTEWSAGPWSSSVDLLTVQVRDQFGAWHDLFSEGGSSSKTMGWLTQTVDLSPYAGQSNLWLRFRFDSNSSYVPSGVAGVWLDQVTVTADVFDLSWLSVTPASTYVAPGGTVNLTAKYEVHNQPAPGAFDTQFRLSRDAVWGNADDLVLFSPIVYPVLGYGDVGIHTRNYSFTMPAGAQGTYRLLGKIDSADALTEGLETNNIYVAPEAQSISTYWELSGSLLTVHGTGGDDRFGAIAGLGSLLLSCNDEFRLFATSAVSTVIFHGEGGNDKMFALADGALTEAAHLHKGSLSLSSTTYGIQADSVEEIFVIGQAGDTAHLYDSTGNETFKAEPNKGQMTGAGFTNKVEGFQYVRGYATIGNDTAILIDSPGDDTLQAHPTIATLTGTGFFLLAQGFDRVNAYATAGGTDDQAFFYDSAGDDNFYALPTYSYMTGPGFYNFAKGFDKAYAYATAGGANDRAFFYDSAGDDNFYAFPTYSCMTGPGFYTYAKGFDKAYAYATAGGANDRAFFHDSAGDDTFHAFPTYSCMTGPGFYTHAQGFEKAYAYATAGGINDRAFFYDSAGDDTFHAFPTYSCMTGPGFYTHAQGFDKVYAYATAGGTFDRAYLYDSAGNDKFYGRTDYGYLSGTGFYNYVKGFDWVQAIGSLGTNQLDVAGLAYTFTKTGPWV